MTLTPLTIKDIEAAQTLAADNSNAAAHFFHVYADLDNDGTSTPVEIKTMFDSLDSYGGGTLDEYEQVTNIAIGTLLTAALCAEAPPHMASKCEKLTTAAERAMDYLDKHSEMAQDPVPPIKFEDMVQASTLDADHKNVIAHSLYLSARPDPSTAPTGYDVFKVFYGANTDNDDHLSGPEQEQALKAGIEILSLALMFDNPALLEGNPELKTYVNEHRAELDAAKAERELCIEALGQIQDLRAAHMKKFEPPKKIKTSRI